MLHLLLFLLRKTFQRWKKILASVGYVSRKQEAIDKIGPLLIKVSWIILISQAVLHLSLMGKTAFMTADLHSWHYTNTVIQCKKKKIGVTKQVSLGYIMWQKNSQLISQE